MFKKILCAVDGSDHSRRALELAIDLAKKYDAELLLAHSLLRNSDTTALAQFARVEGLSEQVGPELRRLQAMDGRLEVGSYYDDRIVSSRVLVEVGQRVLDDAKADAKEAGATKVDTILLDGDAADQLLRCIDEKGIDCAVLGSRGLSDVKALLLGSVSHKVLNRAACTCIAVK